MSTIDILRRLIWGSPKPLRPQQDVGRSAARKPALIQVAIAEDNIEVGVPRYPPIDNGIKVTDPEVLIASQSDLLNILKKNLGLPAEEFEFAYMAPIRRAADLVNLLPATRDKHHTGAGGLFRYALTLAVRSAQSAEGRMFAARENIESRRQIEAAWRHAAFLTGLTSELFRPMTEMLIVDEAGGEWSPFVDSLTAWAHNRKISKFFVRWHQRDDVRSAANTLSSWAVGVVIGNELLSRLNTIKPGIVEAIYGVASGSITTADNSTLAALISDVRRRVIERDNEVSPITYGKLTSGSHLEPYFLDAMRTLLRTGVWQVNTKSARCHYGSDGLYVAWRLGAQEMLAHLHKEKIPGVPTSRATLEEMMGKAGIIAVSGDGSWVHLVRSSVASSVTMPAIKIQSPAAVLGNLDVKPIADTLKVNANKASAADKNHTVALSNPVPKVPEQKTPDASATPQSPNGTPDPDTGEIIETPTPTPTPIPPATKPTPNVASTPQGSAPARIVKEKPSPKGGIPSVPDVEDDVVDSFDKALLLELGAPICRELAVWRDLWNRGQESSNFLRTSEGLGISIDLLSKSAVQYQTINEQLKANAYLEIARINGKDRTFRSLPFEKKEMLGLVLKTTFARKAGFTLD
jgi:conjugal transfer pilus assembly protein TraI